MARIKEVLAKVTTAMVGRILLGVLPIFAACGGGGGGGATAAPPPSPPTVAQTNMSLNVLGSVARQLKLRCQQAIRSVSR